MQPWCFFETCSPFLTRNWIILFSLGYLICLLWSTNSLKITLIPFLHLIVLNDTLSGKISDIFGYWTYKLQLTLWPQGVNCFKVNSEDQESLTRYISGMRARLTRIYPVLLILEKSYVGSQIYWIACIFEHLLWKKLRNKHSRHVENEQFLLSLCAVDGLYRCVLLKMMTLSNTSSHLDSKWLGVFDKVVLEACGLLCVGFAQVKGLVVCLHECISRDIPVKIEPDVFSVISQNLTKLHKY